MGVNLRRLRWLALVIIPGAMLHAQQAKESHLPAGEMRDLIQSHCTECHSVSVITTQRNTYPRWVETLDFMRSRGATIPDKDFDPLASYLAKNFPDNRTGGPHTENFAEYQAIPGEPVQIRPPENPKAVPAFPGQTRAPCQKSQAYNVTIITDKLHTPWSLAFLPDGKFLVTEKHPAALRIVDANGTVSEPLTGLAGVARTPDMALLDVVLDPHFAEDHLIFFTFVELSHPGGKSIESNTFVARGRLDESSDHLDDVKVIFRAAPEIPSPFPGLQTGGRIAIDNAGNLFVTIGDRSMGSLSEEPQHLDNDIGKIIT